MKTATLLPVLIASALLGACAQPVQQADGGCKVVEARPAKCSQAERRRIRYRNDFLRARRVGGTRCEPEF